MAELTSCWLLRFSSLIKRSVAAALWWQFLACGQRYLFEYVCAPSQGVPVSVLATLILLSYTRISEYSLLQYIHICQNIQHLRELYDYMIPCSLQQNITITMYQQDREVTFMHVHQYQTRNFLLKIRIYLHSYLPIQLAVWVVLSLIWPILFCSSYLQ